LPLSDISRPLLLLDTQPAVLDILDTCKQ
jgi:hypothetical protein